MNWFTGILVYVMIWWMTLFAVLPFGVRNQVEDGEYTQGTELGAPVDAKLPRKLVITTLVSAVIFLIVFAIIASGVISLDDIPFGSDIVRDSQR